MAMTDRFEDITFARTINGRPYGRIERQHPKFAPNLRYVAQFGSRAATSLLLLELAAFQKVPTSWDAEWYQGEFISRLRAVTFAEPWATQGYKASFDSEARWYAYETLDMSALTLTTQRRYRALLLSVLRSIYDEEGIRGQITEAARAAFKLPRF